MASANALIRLQLSAAGAGGVGYGWPPQHIGIGDVCPYVGCITRVTKCGSMLVVVLMGLTGILQVAACLLITFAVELTAKFYD